MVAELKQLAGPKRAVRLEERLDSARRSFERERYAEARVILLGLIKEAPTSASIRELLGLTLYRLGKWREAARELETYRQLTMSIDQHPVLADCYRGMRRFNEVEALWTELKETSPTPELVTEGRIVMAGSLADRGRMAEAIGLMEKSMKAVPANVQERHLRAWYALADLYDRAGDVPRARQLFGRVAQHEPDFGDVPTRLRSLGR